MEINITIKLTEKESNEFFNKLMGIIEDEPNDKSERVVCSNYAKWFNDSCAGWTNDAENNKMFLKYQESYMNEKLRSQGYLFLNDVYRSLGGWTEEISAQPHHYTQLQQVALPHGTCARQVGIDEGG